MPEAGGVTADQVSETDPAPAVATEIVGAERLPTLTPGCGRVRTLYSGVSRGTERLVLSGGSNMVIADILTGRPSQLWALAECSLPS